MFIHNSKSIVSLFTQNSTVRNFQYSEMDNGTNDSWVISNGQYKLFANGNGNSELYNLVNDPYEQDNLLNGTLTIQETNVLSELEGELANIRQ